MKVFKFGGASVKNAEAIENVYKILTNFSNEQLVVVVSAMDKTTNALENILNLWKNNDENIWTKFNELKDFHVNIAKKLFNNTDNEVFSLLDNKFESLKNIISIKHIENQANYSLIVSHGEYFSSIILNSYLINKGLCCKLFDAKELIITNAEFPEAVVDKNETYNRIQKSLSSYFTEKQGFAIALTQGFISGTTDGIVTTLGREGSDYTASLFANALGAEEMIVWKDVPGLMNADPKLFPDVNLINHISYREAIELTYFGASVIHPKTLKPLQNKNIPLKVKSFFDINSKGTIIDSKQTDDFKVSSLIIKQKQMLLSIQASDYSFIVEKNLSQIFEIFSEIGIKTNIMQLSALSFSVCFDMDAEKSKKLFEKLKNNFKYKYNENLSLITVRRFSESQIKKLLSHKKVYLEQRSRITAQFVVK